MAEETKIEQGPTAKPQDWILVTGATGFIGRRVVENLLARGFRNIRCLVRPTSSAHTVDGLMRLARAGQRLDVIQGNLLSPDDCAAVTRGVVLVLHLAAARGEKSIPMAYMNSVLTTRNLMEATLRHGCLRRFVSVSSFVVYTNSNKRQRDWLDETCPVEQHPELRDSYCFAKVKQDEMVTEYGNKFGVPYVIMRPGFVYGPGNEGLTGRVGITTFGPFLHLGGGNPIPVTYVDNCADAIVAAGLAPGVEQEVFNVVDDDLPSSRKLLRLYKQNVKKFNSYYVPHFVSYAMCYLWEWYSQWSEGQLPPAFSRKLWHNSWKKTKYTNQKHNSRAGWVQRVSTEEGLRRYFEACRNRLA